MSTSQHDVASNDDIPRIVTILQGGGDVLVYDINQPGYFNMLTDFAVGPFTFEREEDGTYTLYGKEKLGGAFGQLRLVNDGDLVGIVQTRLLDGEWKNHGMGSFRLLISKRDIV
jgi:hypothetical protein